MEIVEIAGIKKQEVRALIDEVPLIWNRGCGVFDQGMKPLLRNFGEKGNLLFGVHVHSMGQQYIVVILTEHDSETNKALMRIHMSSIGGLLGPKKYEEGEEKLRKAVEKSMDETLSAIRAKYTGDLSWRGVDFKCPLCGSLYFLPRKLIDKNGKTRCQNCDKLVSAKTA